MTLNSARMCTRDTGTRLPPAGRSLMGTVRYMKSNQLGLGCSNNGFVRAVWKHHIRIHPQEGMRHDGPKGGIQEHSLKEKHDGQQEEDVGIECPSHGVIIPSRMPNNQGTTIEGPVQHKHQRCEQGPQECELHNNGRLGPMGGKEEPKSLIGTAAKNHRGQLLIILMSCVVC